VGIGTFAYRKTGKGMKGILIGLAAATVCNVAWEGFEMLLNPFNSPEVWADTISDAAVVYMGTMLSFFGDKWEKYLDRK
jgi:hypothetical protein